MERIPKDLIKVYLIVALAGVLFLFLANLYFVRWSNRYGEYEGVTKDMILSTTCKVLWVYKGTSYLELPGNRQIAIQPARSVDSERLDLSYVLGNGDSLVKSSGSDTLIVFKNNLRRIFILDLDD